jgi:hypothetical protein
MISLNTVMSTIPTYRLSYKYTATRSKYKVIVYIFRKEINPSADQRGSEGHIDQERHRDGGSGNRVQRFRQCGQKESAIELDLEQSQKLLL